MKIEILSSKLDEETKILTGTLLVKDINNNIAGELEYFKFNERMKLKTIWQVDGLPIIAKDRNMRYLIFKELEKEEKKYEKERYSWKYK